MFQQQNRLSCWKVPFCLAHSAYCCCSCTNLSPRMLVVRVGILMKQKPQIVIISHHGSGWHNAWAPSTTQSWKLAKMSLMRACVWSGWRQRLKWWGGRKSCCSFKRRCNVSSLITSGRLIGDHSIMWNHNDPMVSSGIFGYAYKQADICECLAEWCAVIGCCILN